MQLEELAAESGRDGNRFWERLYEEVAPSIFGEDALSLNLGFLESSSVQMDHSGLDGTELSDRLSLQLYERVLQGVSLAGRTVLEVGCGRGGGCAYMAAANCPAEVIGLDRSRALVEACARAHRIRSVRFLQGDASRLPLADRSVDVVVNVESSHCYPSRLEFFEEVRRVLAPGGHFAFADIFGSVRGLDFPDDTAPHDVEGLLGEVGLRALSGEDITPGVVESRRLVSNSSAFQRRLAEYASSRTETQILRNLFFLRGSPGYAGLISGQVQYWSWTAVRSEAISSSDR